VGDLDLGGDKPPPGKICAITSRDCLSWEGFAILPEARRKAWNVRIVQRDRFFSVAWFSQTGHGPSKPRRETLHVGSETELRMLWSRLAAGGAGCADLLLRVHILHSLRRNPSRGALSELPRRACTTPDQTGHSSCAKSSFGSAGA